MGELSLLQFFLMIALTCLAIVLTSSLWSSGLLRRQANPGLDLKLARDDTVSDTRSVLKNSLPKAKTIRISQIPRTVDRDELYVWLKGWTVPTGPQNSAQQSVAQVASSTLNKLESPEILIVPFDSSYYQALLRDSSIDHDILKYEMILGLHGCEYSIDEHFRGITVLYAGNEGDAEDSIMADIILVHGLGGHAIGSWKSRTNSKFWPLDFLPKDVKHVRIMTYGCDTTLHINDKNEHHGKKSIDSLAISMLEAISNIRKDKISQNRPIIFMGHSLGGLVIKSAIISAMKNRKHEPWLNIFQNSRALIFFGVPNLGMSFEELAMMVDGKESEQLVRDLLVDKDNDPRPLLQKLNDDFVDCIQDRDVEVLCYYETQLSQPILKENLEKHQRGTLIVNKTSASYTGLTIKSYNVLELEGDHRSMVKFTNPNNQGYQGLSGRVRHFVDRITKESYVEKSELTTEDHSCLRSFAFLEMNYRRQEADEYCPDTCNWILRHECYQAWSIKDRGLLWIMGKPGSGKSILMAFLYKQLQDSTLTERALSITFFFHRRGTELQKTIIGMLRSFMHQLYVKSSVVRQLVLHSFKEKSIFGEAGTAWQWQLGELKGLFSKAVELVAVSQKMIIFIDALDEAGEESARELVTYFHAINDQIAREKGTAKICISCRYYPVVATIPGLRIRVENNNNADIATYVRARLRSNLLTEDEEQESTSRKDLEALIVERALGVFQWACLIIPMVIKFSIDGKSLDDIQAMLTKIPQRLYEVYEHILKEVIDRRDLSRTLLLVQWIHLAVRPLSLTELRYAMAVDDTAIHPARVSARDARNFIDSDDRMRKLTLSLSGGLAEVRQHETGSTIQFVHQSVNDFLQAGGLAFLLSTSEGGPASSVSLNLVQSSLGEIIGQSQDRLCRSCINYLRLAEVLNMERVKVGRELHRYQKEETTKAASETIREALPFIDYATSHWVVHAEKAEGLGVSQAYLVQIFDSLSGETLHAWTDFHHILDTKEYGFSSKSPHTNSKLVHIASLYNLYTTTQALLDLNIDVNETDAAGNRPLHYAAREGFTSLVKIFLHNSAEIEAKNIYQNTALELAAANGHGQVAELLLRSGADVNVSTGKSGNALHGASSRGSGILVRLLLKNGADVNAQGGYFGNVLQAASRNGNKAIVQLLLDAGADVNVQGGHLGNALQAASWSGSEAMVQLLLDAGVDVNAQGGKYGSALQAASSYGHEAIMRLLLEHGAKEDLVKAN